MLILFAAFQFQLFTKNSRLTEQMGKQTDIEGICPQDGR
jgi:hypothetical protein